SLVQLSDCNGLFFVFQRAFRADPLVVGRHDLHELLQRLFPVLENLPRYGGGRVAQVLADQSLQFLDVGVAANFFEFVGFGVALGGEGVVPVPDIGDAATHAGAEVAPGLAQHYNAAACHVFTAVVTDAFHHRGGAAVAYCEALCRDAAEVSFATGGTIQVDVAGDDVLFGLERAVLRRIDDDLA